MLQNCSDQLFKTIVFWWSLTLASLCLWIGRTILIRKVSLLPPNLQRAYYFQHAQYKWFANRRKRYIIKKRHTNTILL